MDLLVSLRIFSIATLRLKALSLNALSHITIFNQSLLPRNIAMIKSLHNISVRVLVILNEVRYNHFQLQIHALELPCTRGMLSVTIAAFYTY